VFVDCVAKTGAGNIRQCCALHQLHSSKSETYKSGTRTHWKGRKKVEDELCAEGPVTAVTSDDMDSAQDLTVDSGTDGS
jgi:hypothetical protein